MYQTSLLEKEYLRNEVVNVQSVPKRSPFRYPGGKTWLVPRIREWIYSLDFKPDTLLEPFAGGGIVGLTAAFENLTNKVILVELDEDVSSVWKTILGKDWEWLANRIVNFEINHEAVDELFSSTPSNTKERAFHTIVKNRVNRGGILANGAGRLKKGENGKGIKSRWYPVTLANRIKAISTIREKITFIQGDGIEYIKKYLERKNFIIFADPPYTASKKKAGSRLYKYHELNHDQLFKLVKDFSGDPLMTYDNAEEVLQLAKKYQLKSQTIAMKNTNHAQMTELVVGKNLDWL